MFRKACTSCRVVLRTSLMLIFVVVSASGGVGLVQATRSRGATAGARQIGTVKAVADHSLTLTTDAGQQLSIMVGEDVRILQLAPGSTNLKEAQTIALTDIAVADRVLVTGRAGADANSFEASRVILMKSNDIAQKHAQEEADWQKRGVAGIVSTLGDGVVTITEGAKKVMIKTSSKTQFRRYAGDSVKFEDAMPGSLAQIEPGDQLRVRGEKSADGSTIDADEVVSGSFKNLAGILTAIDAANGTLILKDLATNKLVKVKVTPNSSVHALTPEAAALFAARAKSEAASRPHDSQSSGGAQGQGVQIAPKERQAGFDLSQMVSHLPNEPFSDLKVGHAVMIVASQSDPASQTETAVTLLSGVEPILAATPSGSPSMTLSPWSMGGGGAESGGQP